MGYLGLIEECWLRIGGGGRLPFMPGMYTSSFSYSGCFGAYFLMSEGGLIFKVSRRFSMA